MSLVKPLIPLVVGVSLVLGIGFLLDVDVITEGIHEVRRFLIYVW